LMGFEILKLCFGILPMSMLILLPASVKNTFFCGVNVSLAPLAMLYPLLHSLLSLENLAMPS
ncbi:MAG: hypothetical protein MR629_00040, partial [Helicobacter sp.]|nr:hypothetical protein [Helicobacter sp.]